MLARFLSLSLSSFWLRPIAVGLCAALLSRVAIAAEVIVVTDNHHPVQAPPGIRVIELDQAARIEAELAADLPADPARASAQVQQRLKAGGAALQRRIGEAYQGVVDAWSLGITTIPAVVVDRRYVVYGEGNLDGALERVAQYRREQP